MSQLCRILSARWPTICSLKYDFFCVVSVCYEAMGSIRYQPGEEFMHGEWWCKCDPKKKSYQEMCTRLKCTIGDLVRTLRRHDIEIARIVSMLYKCLFIDLASL